MKIDSRHEKLILSLGSIAAIVILGGVIAYGFESADPFSTAVKKVYPAALVGSRVISVQELESAHRAAKSLDPNAGFNSVYNVLIRNVKMEILADKLGIKPASDAVPDEHTYYTRGRLDEYNSFVHDHLQGKESLFNQIVVYPAVYESLLAIEYNSDFAANKSAYDKAVSILNKIKTGQRFEDVAKAESDDEFTAQTGGDLGFFEHGQILPELEKEIAISSMGQVKDKIVVSRLGYHIIYPVETINKDGKKLWHVKHILVKTSGFDSWFETQTKDVKVRKIIK